MTFKLLLRPNADGSNLLERLPISLAQPLPECPAKPWRIRGAEAVESRPEQDRFPGLDFCVDSCCIHRNSLHLHLVSLLAKNFQMFYQYYIPAHHDL